MTSYQNICVYCASSNSVDQKYKDIAVDLGRLCAARGRSVVYGGGHVGLMGLLADSALADGGEVIGVIPTLLKDMEVAHASLTHLHITDDMQSRQLKMAELSDAFIVLPGGLGTLAEFFEIITWKQLGLHDKPIVVLNAYGYWDDLIQAISHARDEKFLRQSPVDLFDVCDGIEGIERRLFKH